MQHTLGTINPLFGHSLVALSNVALSSMVFHLPQATTSLVQPPCHHFVKANIPYKRQGGCPISTDPLLPIQSIVTPSRKSSSTRNVDDNAGGHINNPDRTFTNPAIVASSHLRYYLVQSSLPRHFSLFPPTSVVVFASSAIAEVATSSARQSSTANHQ